MSTITTDPGWHFLAPGMPALIRGEERYVVREHTGTYEYILGTGPDAREVRECATCGHQRPDHDVTSTCARGPYSVFVASGYLDGYHRTMTWSIEGEAAIGFDTPGDAIGWVDRMDVES